MGTERIGFDPQASGACTVFAAAAIYIAVAMTSPVSGQWSSGSDQVIAPDPVSPTPAVVQPAPAPAWPTYSSPGAVTVQPAYPASPQPQQVVPQRPQAQAKGTQAVILERVKHGAVGVEAVIDRKPKDPQPEVIIERMEKSHE